LFPKFARSQGVKVIVAIYIVIALLILIAFLLWSQSIYMRQAVYVFANELTELKTSVSRVEESFESMQSAINQVNYEIANIKHTVGVTWKYFSEAEAKINDQVFYDLAAVLGELNDVNLNLSCISDDVKAIAGHPAFTRDAGSADDIL
jgi:septal ring factor EnvC (AmiA/AmiB activator)